MSKDVDARSNGEKRPAAGPNASAGGPKSPSPPRVDWRGADLRESNMAGINLEHADLRAGDLRDVNFSGSNLRYADFRGSDVSGANFQNANLYGAKMQGVVADGTDFRKSDLRRANFGGAYLEKAMMPTLTPSQIVDGLGGAPAQEVIGHDQKQGWAEQVEQKQKENQGGNASDGQNEQAKGRFLPVEQRQKERDPGRGR
jgi:hypothetical protein